MLLYYIIIMLRFLAITSSQIEPKIILGEKSKIRNHPFSVYIVITQGTSAHICGASIVNQKVILTAAHCFDEMSRKTRGTAYTGHATSRKGCARRITKIKIHPKYDTNKITNDIALAGFKREIKFGDVISRVALAQRRPRQGYATIAGWGLIGEKPYKDTNLLHETEQKIWPMKDCIKLLKRLPKGTFCGSKGYKGGYPSMGDSGSPLVMHGFLQIGLVSFKKMHISTSVIIYTDISYYYKWITKNIKPVFCG